MSAPALPILPLHARPMSSLMQCNLAANKQSKDYRTFPYHPTTVDVAQQCACRVAQPPSHVRAQCLDDSSSGPFAALCVRVTTEPRKPNFAYQRDCGCGRFSFVMEYMVRLCIAKGRIIGCSSGLNDWWLLLSTRFPAYRRMEDSCHQCLWKGTYPGGGGVGGGGGLNCATGLIPAFPCVQSPRLIAEPMS